MKQIAGICPKCQEHTEVTCEDNGCCDRGCYAEGSYYSSDKLSAQIELAIGDQALLEAKERKYFKEEI